MYLFILALLTHTAFVVCAGMIVFLSYHPFPKSLSQERDLLSLRSDLYLFILFQLTHTAFVVCAGMIVFLFCDGFEEGDVVGYGGLEVGQKNVFFRTMCDQN